MISEKKIVNVASYGRIDSLIRTIQSIIHQCDELNVVLNSEITDIPNILFDKKINLIFSDNSYGDAMKFYMLEESDGYYLTIDDDIVYPNDYVDHMIQRCKDYENSKIITLHGRSFDRFPIKSYYSFPSERYSCFSNVKHDVKVQFGGTGVMCFHTNLLKLKIDYFEKPNMADIWIGKYALLNNIEIIVAKHGGNYVQYIPQKTTIYDVESKNDNTQTNVVNSIFMKDYNETTYNLNEEKTIDVKIEKTIELKKKELNYEKINVIFNSHHAPTQIKSNKILPPQPKLNSNSATISKMFGNNKRKIR